MIFQAGLQNISPSVLEAASIDGASALRCFRIGDAADAVPHDLPIDHRLHLLAPGVRHRLRLVKNAGPDNATRTIVYHIYELGLEKGLGCPRRRPSSCSSCPLRSRSFSSASRRGSSTMRTEGLRPRPECASGPWPPTFVLALGAIAMFAPFVWMVLTGFKTLPQILKDP